MRRIIAITDMIKPECFLDEALINTYYRLHIPDFPEIKSEEVLRELFS